MQRLLSRSLQRPLPSVLSAARLGHVLDAGPTPLQVKDAAMEKILKVEQEAHAECIPIYKERMDAIAKIPSFWKFVLLQHGVLRDLIMEDDEEVLDYLEQVTASDHP